MTRTARWHFTQPVHEPQWCKRGPYGPWGTCTAWQEHWAQPLKALHNFSHLPWIDLSWSLNVKYNVTFELRIYDFLFVFNNYICRNSTSFGVQKFEIWVAFNFRWNCMAFYQYAFLLAFNGNTMANSAALRDTSFHNMGDLDLDRTRSLKVKILWCS